MPTTRPSIYTAFQGAGEAQSFGESLLANLTPFFDYPPEIRKVIYTTNAVESINAQLRKVTKHRGAFPTPDAVRKVLYLAISKASERWTRPIPDWTAALNHLSIVFEGRIPV